MSEFRYSNIEREMEVYGYDSFVKSHCRMCHGGCGVIVYVKNGKVAKIAGDPDCPIAHGNTLHQRACLSTACLPSGQLTYPVKRVGPKASGQWERISWDEALDTIAERILTYKRNTDLNRSYSDTGPAGKMRRGLPHCNVLGSPNVSQRAISAMAPVSRQALSPVARIPLPDYENFPKCIMWGNNPVTISTLTNTKANPSRSSRPWC